MKHLIANIMIFLVLSGAIASIQAGQNTQPEPQDQASTFSIDALKAAFQFGWQTGWSKK